MAADPLQFTQLLSQFQVTKIEAQPVNRPAHNGSNDVPFGGLLQSHPRVAFFCLRAAWDLDSKFRDWRLEIPPDVAGTPQSGISAASAHMR